MRCRTHLQTNLSLSGTLQKMYFWSINLKKSIQAKNHSSQCPTDFETNYKNYFYLELDIFCVFQILHSQHVRPSETSVEVKHPQARGRWTCGQPENTNVSGSRWSNDSEVEWHPLRLCSNHFSSSCVLVSPHKVAQFSFGSHGGAVCFENVKFCPPQAKKKCTFLINKCLSSFCCSFQRNNHHRSPAFDLSNLQIFALALKKKNSFVAQPGFFLADLMQI